MEKLKDIKGLLYVDDYSLYIFALLVIISLLVLYFLIKIIINFKRKLSPEKLAKMELKNIDLTDIKKSSYTLSRYAPVLSEENFEYLEKYKYKKEVIDFTKEDLQKIKGFLDAI